MAQHDFLRLAQTWRFVAAALFRDVDGEEYPVERGASSIAVVSASDQVTPGGEMVVGSWLSWNGPH